MKIEINKNLKQLIAGGLALCTVAGIGSGYALAKKDYINKQMLLSQAKLYDSLKLNMTGVNTAEYGSEFDLHTLVAEHTGDLKIKGDINENEVGEYLITLTLFGKEARFGITDSKSFMASVNVIDTKYPEIVLASDAVALNAGDSFDAYSNISSVTDPVDGALTLSETDGPGLYTVVSDVDTSRAGTYTATVTATDKNGNVSSSAYTVTVKRPSAVNTAGFTARAVDTAGNYQTIYAYLTGTLGLSKAAACGVLANMYQESKFNPTAGSYYYGLCQWGGGRYTNLVNYCAENGLDYTTVEGQLAYMTSELNGPYYSTLAGLQGVADTAEGAAEAATIFVQKYEGASHTAGRAEMAYSYFLAE